AQRIGDHAPTGEVILGRGVTDSEIQWLKRGGCWRREGEGICRSERMMLVRQTLSLLLLSLCTLPVPVWAEVHSITATGEYRMGDHDSLADAKRVASSNAKALAVGEAGTYLENVPAVKQRG